MFELDIVPPKNALDTLALGPKNPVLEKFDQNVMLAEIDLLLKRFKEQNASNEIVSDKNITTVNYIKKCSKESIPRNVIMMNVEPGECGKSDEQLLISIKTVCRQLPRLYGIANVHNPI